MLETDKNEESNFWISYADLMAGLLFVFILVVGAIVVKTVLISSDLQAIRTDLQKEKDALSMSEEALAKRKAEIRKLQRKLFASQAQNAKMAMKLSLLKSEVEELNATVEVLSFDIRQKAQSLSLTQKELDTLKNILLEKEDEVAQLQENLAQSKEKRELLQQEYALKLQLKEGELAQLEKALLLKSRAYQKVVEDLNITKLKIKNLTGIKVKVVQQLKEKLGDSIKIDPKSGALRFSSNILFNQGESKLKPEAKKALRTQLAKYIDTLLKEKDIRKYIDTIVIEGHTNSDGSYMYNLYLSQQRALAVMEFLFKEYPQNRKLFREYLTASGRSYSQPVYDKDGKEDKDASRRIEIKFYIKSNAAIQELKNFLGE